ncbi:MAG: nucleotide sugar dehydrogenase [Ruminiclostridium sp.]|nr:nucleotide sugar dehydrogenase [Ruminiclostridium sp.]
MCYEQLIEKKTKLAVIGLGYVGLPLAIEFAKSIPTIGFDVNCEKLESYRAGIDCTGELKQEELASTTLRFTCDEKDLDEASFFIIAVPTPINRDKTPDLKPIVSATEIVGRHLSKGDIVTYESTVYPGVTEDICAPILEAFSGLKCGTDFKIGYSPERINPGDTEHSLRKIRKIVSGMDAKVLETITKVYGLVVDAGLYKAKSIRVAEAAKVIENAQRDINIAFMNELAIIFNRLGIDTQSVLEAAATKWNFLPFRPGLVGGHCIGVDPYYLTYRAEQTGYHPQIILSGRRINDAMGKYIAENVVKQMIHAGVHINGATVCILGFTFKENVPDVRNTKVIDIYQELQEYDIKVLVTDPCADKKEALHEYGVHLVALEDIPRVDCLVFAVKHNAWLEIDWAIRFKEILADNGVIVDVKGMFSTSGDLCAGYTYWKL